MSTPTADLGTIGDPDPDLEAGTRVGEYDVEGKLGQGAFGKVFRGMHPVIGKVVAIKVLARKFSVDPEMVSRFMAEARAVNQIRHRHIIDIFSYGTLEDGRLYYVMEYLDGEPLDALLDRVKILPIGDALVILRAIAKALDAAHGKGVAHRDLKAENIFLGTDPDGGVFPKLLDFGIAKLMAPEDGLKHKTRTGIPVGTPYYMSPEQCRGRDVDHRTDLYAFGVLTYLMLTGVFPHDADDYMAILMKQVSDEPAPPSVHRAELTPEIDQVVLWLMHKDPSQRPADLRTAVRALEQAAAAAGLVDAPTSAWDVQTGPTSKPFQTQAVVAAAGGTSAARATGSPVRGREDTGQPAEVALPARSRTPLVLGAGLVVAIGAVIAVLVLRGGDERPVPAPESPAQVQAPPPVAPPPIKEVPVADPPPPDAAAEAQTVIVTIKGVPDGTEVLAGGMTVGAAPGPVQLPRDRAPLVLTFKAEGYLTTSKEVIPDKDQELAMTLKKRGGGGGTRPTRNDLLDPFKRKR